MKVVLTLMGCLFLTHISAQHVELTDIDIESKGNQWLIKPNYDIDLTSAIKEAIHNGIEITFVSKMRLIEERSWWPDKTISEQSKRFEIHYFSLSSQYQLKQLETAKTTSFMTLDNLMIQLAHNTAFKMPQNQYASYVEGELYLDHRALPSTMQLPIMLDKQWSLKAQAVRKPLPGVDTE